MTSEYQEFKRLISRRKYREAALFAEEQFFTEKSLFWITQQAYAHNKAGHYNKALERAKEVLTLEPDNAYGLVTAADALMGLHRVEEALEYYKEAERWDKVRERALKGTCECLARLHQWQELLDTCASLPGNRADIMLYTIKALKATGNGEKALAECREALKQNPDDPGLLWELTEMEIEEYGIEQVIEQLGRLSKIKTLPPVYKEIYASLCRRAGKHDMALKTYDKIKTPDQDMRIQRKKAFTLAKTGCEAEALPLLEELMTINPKDMYVHASYGAACARIGEVERGINFYNALLARFPDEKGIYGYIKRLKKKLDT